MSVELQGLDIYPLPTFINFLSGQVRLPPYGQAESRNSNFFLVHLMWGVERVDIWGLNIILFFLAMLKIMNVYPWHFILPHMALQPPRLPHWAIRRSL